MLTHRVTFVTPPQIHLLRQAGRRPARKYHFAGLAPFHSRVAEQGRGRRRLPAGSGEGPTESTGFSEVTARDGEIRTSPPMNAQVLILPAAQALDEALSNLEAPSTPASAHPALRRCGCRGGVPTSPHNHERLQPSRGSFPPDTSSDLLCDGAGAPCPSAANLSAPDRRGLIRLPGSFPSSEHAVESPIGTTPSPGQKMG
jgi:hypothetical protein